MPELAAFAAVGILVCAGIGLNLLRLSLRRLDSRAARVLQGNLQLAGLYWSDQGDALVKWEPDALARERDRAKRTVALTTVLFCMGSWLGAFGLAVLTISILFVGRSPLERALFSSELAQKEGLPAEAVHALVREIAARANARIDVPIAD